MAICTFFLRGQCKFGDNCRNEHPDAQHQGGFGSQSWSNPNRNNNTNVDSKLAFTVDVMRNDLTPQKDKPLWPLSSYAAAKHESNLLSGLDESPEELRVRAVTTNKSGKWTEYVAYENKKIAAAEQAFSNARDNINQAFEQAAKQSINAPGKTAASSVLGGTSAFGAPASTSAFGNPASTSAFGGTASTSAFGNPSSTSAFGSTTTTSAFGNPTTSAFGKSGFGQPTFGQSAFGQTTAPGATSAFGRPAPATSAFGQPSQPVSAFGQSVSAFGQPQPPQQPVSAFGQPQQPVSAFGQPAQSSLIKPASGAFGALGASTTNAFGGGAFSSFAGQPSAFGSGAPATGGSAFGQSAFGAPASGQPTSAFGTSAAPATSAFGPSAPATSAFANTAPATSAFGTPATATSAFSAAAAPTTSAFGAPSAFGALAQQPAKPAFGTSAFGTTTNTVFGPTGATPSNAFTNPNNAVSSPFAPRTTTISFPSTSAAPGLTSAPSEPPPLSAFPMASPSTSTAFTSTAFTQPPAAAGGPPDFSKVKSLYKPGLTPYDQILPADYIKRIPQVALEAFQSQKFEWGTVPDWIPPLEVR